MHRMARPPILNASKILSIDQIMSFYYVIGSIEFLDFCFHCIKNFLSFSLSLGVCVALHNKIQILNTQKNVKIHVQKPRPSIPFMLSFYEISLNCDVSIHNFFFFFFYFDLLICFCFNFSAIIST